MVAAQVGRPGAMAARRRERRMSAGAAMIDAAAIRAHVTLLHDLAEGIAGKLVVAGFGEDPVSGEKLDPVVRHFAVGDVEAMAAAIVDLGRERHRNIYVPMAVFRPDLPAGGKGAEKDVV